MSTLDGSRISLAVDPDAPPSRWDVALARFLLRYVRSRPADAPETDASHQTTGGERTDG